MERRDLIFGGAVVALAGVGGLFEFLRLKRAPMPKDQTQLIPEPPSVIHTQSIRDAVILGDSIGVGLGLVSHLTTYAVVGTQMTDRKRMRAQIAKLTDQDKIVVVSLGTNDAFAKIGNPVEHVLAWLTALGDRTVIWCGPIHPTLAWASRCAALDTMLHALVTSRGVKYLSFYDPTLDKFHGKHGDGIHFTNAGYMALWNKVLAS